MLPNQTWSFFPHCVSIFFNQLFGDPYVRTRCTTRNDQQMSQTWIKAVKGRALVLFFRGEGFVTAEALQRVTVKKKKTVNNEDRMRRKHVATGDHSRKEEGSGSQAEHRPWWSGWTLSQIHYNYRLSPHPLSFFHSLPVYFSISLLNTTISLILVHSSENSAAKMYILFTVLAGLALLAFTFVKTFFPYFGDDCSYILRSLRLGMRLIRYKKIKPFYSILDCFLDAARRHPAKTFVHFEGQQFSYGEVDKQSNRVARALQAAAQLKEGNTAALFLPNEPAFIWTWLALAKLGCTAALLNFNIRSKSLLHCFSCCGAKVIITSTGELMINLPTGLQKREQR